MSTTTRWAHPLTARTQAWRLTIAIRSFGLAFVVGTALSRHSLHSVAPALLGVAVVAAIAAIIELHSFGERARSVAIMESVAAVALLSTVHFDAVLLPYLLVPPVSAGARHGWVPAMNAGLLGVLTLITGAVATTVETEQVLTTGLPWAVLGLAGGVLAGWQTRARRLAEERQAPYSAANDLLNRLHELVDTHSVELDPAFVAERLREQLTDAGAPALAIVVAGHEGTTTLSGGIPSQAAPNVAACLETGRPRQFAGGSCQPLSLSRRVVGAVVFEGDHGGPADATVLVDAALRLETALRFREVRWQATADERRRLSREIHDGVAQEVVALGYLVDDFEAQFAGGPARDIVVLMRREVDRILAGLRASVNAWRSEDRPACLSSSLRAIADSPGPLAGPRVQVTDRGVDPLPPEAHEELLGIAKEAVGNARRHAAADHLWVSLEPTAGGARLRVEDDGVGGAAPVRGHHGMHTMRERAQRVGARLSVSPRPGGGTVIEVAWPAPRPAMGGAPRDVYSAVGR